VANVRSRVAEPTLPLGTIVWLASELMFFAALFAAYYSLSARSTPWPPAGVELDTARTAAFTLILIVSSYTMHRAVHPSSSGATGGAQVWLLVTLVLGVIFLANQVVEYAGLDFEISSHAYGSIYWLLTGFHALHVFGGLLLLAVIGFYPASTGERQRVRLRCSSYFWHFVDAVWVLVFLTIFVVR
jgi:cytochrome c oxidase subunit 3